MLGVGGTGMGRSASSSRDWDKAASEEALLSDSLSTLLSSKFVKRDDGESFDAGVEVGDPTSRALPFSLGLPVLIRSASSLASLILLISRNPFAKVNVPRSSKRLCDRRMA